MTTLDQLPTRPAAVPLTGQQYPIAAGWLQVFTGDPLRPDRRRKALAIEPMTCPPNAFVTADDLLVLEPGQAVTHTWGIQVLSR